jgi:hypothetical protein
MSAGLDAREVNEYWGRENLGQTILDALAAAGKVQPLGRGRARRWMTTPVPGFTTTLLLPAPLPSD